MSFRRRDWAGAAAILLATLIAYLPAMGAGTIWDDQYYLTENLHLGSLEGLRRAWLVIGSSLQYYPMIHTSLWGEYWFYGMDPAGYHFDNILLHAANAILYWRLLARLAVPGAWLAGAVFALHPVEVESVAWISERKNLLSTFFYLGSMHAYLRYEAPEPSARNLDFRYYVLSFGLFCCALFSKTVAFSLPAAIALIFWWKRGRLELASLRPLLPFMAFGALLGSLTIWMEKHLVGAIGERWDFSVADRILIAGRAVWFYLGKLAWPSNLTFSYERWVIDSGAAWQYAYPLAALAALVLAWALRRRLGRGPLTAMLFFGGTLFPALGFVDVFPFTYSFVADHFQYLASLGPIALFAAIAAKGLERIPVRAVQVALVVLLLATLGTLSWRHARAFHDPITLWADVIEKNPTSIMAHNNIAAHYADRSEYEKAVFHNRETLRIDPDDSMAHANLALNLIPLGRHGEAIRNFQIQVERFPNDVESWGRLANLLDARGRGREAIRYYEEAERLGSKDPTIESRLRVLRRRYEVR